MTATMERGTRHRIGRATRRVPQGALVLEWGGRRLDLAADSPERRRMERHTRRLKVVFAGGDVAGEVAAAGGRYLHPLTADCHLVLLRTPDPPRGAGWRFVGDFLPAMALAGGLADQNESTAVLVRAADDAAVAAVLARGLTPLGTPPVGGLRQWAGRMEPEAIRALAAMDGVVRIEPVAAGARFASEGAALILASQTEVLPLHDQWQGTHPIERPVYTSPGSPAVLGAALAGLGIPPAVYTEASRYPLVTVLDSGIDTGDLAAPQVTELRAGGVPAPSRYVAGFQWKYDTPRPGLPLPAEPFPYAEFKGSAALLNQPPLPADRNDPIGHGSGVAQMVAAHPRPGAGVWRDAATGLARSAGASPFGRVAAARWPGAPFPIGGALPPPQPVNNTLLYPGDVIRTVGEIHRQQFYVDADPAELAKPYNQQHAGMAGQQTAIVNGSMGITAPGGATAFDYTSYAEVFDQLTRNGRPTAWYAGCDAPGTRAQTLFVVAAGNTNQPGTPATNGITWGVTDSIYTPGLAKNALTVGGTENFDFMTYGESLLVIGREEAGVATEFPYVVETLTLGPPPTPPACTPGQVVVRPTRLPGDCTTGNFSIELALACNAGGTAPTHFSVLLLPPAGVTLVGTVDGDLGAVTGDFIAPGFLCITSAGDPTNTIANPRLATLNFTMSPASALCSSTALLFFLAYANGLYRDASVVSDTSYGVDPAVAYPAPSQVGPPQRRIKPDIIAPARRVHQRRFPQLDYTISDGTSQATGLTSGLAQLSHFMMTEHYGLAEVSPALLKAYVIHTARPVTGLRSATTVGGTPVRIPSPLQGFGRVRSDYAVAGLPRFFVDQTVVFRRMRSGVIPRRQAVYTGTMPVTAEPLQVALVWTDAPGLPGAPRWTELRNNLNLQVQVRRPNGSFVYYAGNNFRLEADRLHESVEYTYAAGAPPARLLLDPWAYTSPATLDQYNNVEMVHVPPQPVGSIIRVYVRAESLVADALDPFGESPANPAVTARQDFALVAANFVRLLPGDTA